MAAKIAEVMRDEAYAASVEIAQEKGAFPLFDAQTVPRRAALRLAPAADAEGADPRARHAQQPPAVDRADRHDLARVRRQRQQWHRAGVLLDLPAQEARADGTRKVYDVEDHAWRLYRHLGGDVEKLPPAVRHRAGDLRARPHAHGGGGRAVRGLRHQQDGQRARRTIRTRISRTCTSRRGSRGSRASPPTGRTRCSAACCPSTKKPKRRRRTTSTPRTPTAASALEAAPEPALSSLRWPGRPELPAGNPSWTYMVESPVRQASPSSSATSRTATRIRSKYGSTATSSRAAWARWPRRCRWTCARRTRPGCA